MFCNHDKDVSSSSWDDPPALHTTGSVPFPFSLFFLDTKIPALVRLLTIWLSFKVSLLAELLFSTVFYKIPKQLEILKQTKHEQSFQEKLACIATIDLDKTKVPFEAGTRIRVRLTGTLLVRVDILITIYIQQKLSLNEMQLTF